MLLFLFAMLSIGVSFLCSIWEAVLLSVPPSYVHIQQENGTVTGRLLQAFKRDIDRPLSAILSLNTIAHTAGAIGVGAVAEETLGSGNMELFGYALPFSSEAVVGAVMTLAILILSEIIPKTLGATYWKRLTPFTVRSLRVLTLLLAPFIWLSQLITRSLKQKEVEGSIFSRADFKAMAEIGAQSGVFQEDESRILGNLMRFESIRVKDVMTPRTVVVAAEQDMTIGQFYEKFKDLRFSRIPIYEETRDHINGFVLKDEILKNMVEKQENRKLKDIMREIMLVQEVLPVPNLFNTMIEQQEQIAMVIDEFGGMAGLVTMEDVIETLIGLEIVDEMDDTVDMQVLARRNWERRARRIGLLPAEADTESEPSADQSS